VSGLTVGKMKLSQNKEKYRIWVAATATMLASTTSINELLDTGFKSQAKSIHTGTSNIIRRPSSSGNMLPCTPRWFINRSANTSLKAKNPNPTMSAQAYLADNSVIHDFNRCMSDILLFQHLIKNGLNVRILRFLLKKDMVVWKRLVRILSARPPVDFTLIRVRNNERV